MTGAVERAAKAAATSGWRTATFRTPPPELSRSPCAEGSRSKHARLERRHHASHITQWAPTAPVAPRRDRRRDAANRAGGIGRQIDEVFIVGPRHAAQNQFQVVAPCVERESNPAISSPDRIVMRRSLRIIGPSRRPFWRSYGRSGPNDPSIASADSRRGGPGLASGRSRRLARASIERNDRPMWIRHSSEDFA